MLSTSGTGKSIAALVVAAALGLSMTAAQARDFDHRGHSARHHAHHAVVRHHHATHHGSNHYGNRHGFR